VIRIIHHKDFRPLKSRPHDPSNPHGVVQDGEALSFDVMFRDRASARSSSVFLNDMPRIIRRATFTRTLAGGRYQVDSSKLVDMAEGSTRAMDGTVSASPATTHDAAPGRAAAEAMRLARYL